VSTTKQPVKQTKAAKKPPAVKATKKPPVPDPDYYLTDLTDLPPEKGRANIKIEIDGKGTAQASVPAKHLNSFTGLTVGLSAVAAPVVALGIACYAGLPVAAIVTLTAMVTGISLLALLLLFYMLHKGDPSKSK
jgi:hypothetical protein